MSELSGQSGEPFAGEKYSASAPERPEQSPISLSLRRASFSGFEELTEPQVPLTPPDGTPAPLKGGRWSAIGRRPVALGLFVASIILVALIVISVPLFSLFAGHNGQNSNRPSGSQVLVPGAKGATGIVSQETTTPIATTSPKPGQSTPAPPGQLTPVPTGQPTATPTPLPAIIRITSANMQQYSHGCSSDFQLQSADNGLYVSAEMDYTGNNYAMLRARAATVGIWERYNLVYDASTGTWAIQSTDHNMYVSAELDYTGNNYAMLRARASTVDIWERYNLYYDRVNGVWEIQSARNNLYVSTEIGFTGNNYAMLRARASTVGPWEQYHITCGA
jgi:hypothetical protein